MPADFQGNETKISTKEKESDPMLPTIPTTTEVIAALTPGTCKTTVALESVVGTDREAGQALVRLDRFDEVLEDGTVAMDRWLVSFHPAGLDFAEIPASDIPVLIDKLTELHRAWLYLDPANLA
ncbi:hypothetical protein L1080_026280 [Rhodococcus sp. MSC1_016]|uniref:hypothetical protein n=1 Tax=Rhodococcus sp. MSC1_016 TaxID=2909266 RepID=UPI00202F9653|nr:hypothetical protein [Rhodococcus sp. MSC1_016]